MIGIPCRVKFIGYVEEISVWSVDHYTFELSKVTLFMLVNRMSLLS